MFYSPTQWMFLFFVYCFLGWVWETAYVSIRTGHLKTEDLCTDRFYRFTAVAPL